MKPIRDPSALTEGSVLYHSAFGFAVVERVEPNAVLLRWRDDGENLPGRVSHDIVRRVYARCAPEGFFARSFHDREALAELLAVRPTEALALLLSDLNGPQTRSDLLDWIAGLKLIPEDRAPHWWSSLVPLLDEDERFLREGDRVQLRSNSTPDVEERLRDPALDPARRLHLLLAHRSELPEAFFVEQLALAWKTGSRAERDLALKASDGVAPSDLLRALLAVSPSLPIDALVHALRRTRWKVEEVDEEVQVALLDAVVRACDAGGPLDQEGRLVAALARWGLPGLEETLLDLLPSLDGKRLVRATFAALPPHHAEKLGLDMLELALRERALDVADWLGDACLSIALIDRHAMVRKLAGDRPNLARWYEERFRGVADRVPRFDEEDEETALTAEYDLSSLLHDPRPIGELPPRSGASLIGLGLALARALSVHHKEGRICDPSPDSVRVLPDETMVVEPGSSMPSLLPGEEPSPARDVYAGAVLLLQCLTGRPWPSDVPAHRVLPYLRRVVPLLPPSSLAPLDAALHPDPRLRPRDGRAWQALWQEAAVAEEQRAYAPPDPTALLQVGYDSHVGRMKVLLTQTNQDALVVSTKGSLSLLVVCDGISTANAGTGDVASSIAANVIVSLWEQALPRLVSAEPAAIRTFLDRALRMANQAVCEAALRLAGGDLHDRVPMGTTALVGLAFGNRVWLAWLGDSRAYIAGSYGVSLLTYDENQASERLQGWFTGNLPRWDPSGFALVGYLGHFDELGRPAALPANHSSFSLCPGETLLLCSDGVTDYLGDTHPEVCFFLNDALGEEDPFDAAQRLVGLANQGGGGDNITTIVASLLPR